MLNKILLTIIILIGLGLSYYICTNVNKQVTNVNTISDTITVYDTNVYYIDSIKYTNVTTHYADTIPVFDTQIVIKEYFATKVYDRVYDDSNLCINIHDSVYKNTLFTGGLNYKWKQPVTIINNTTTINSKYLLVGGSVPFKDLSWVSLNVILVKDKWSYGINYIPMQKGLSGSLYYNLKIK